MIIDFHTHIFAPDVINNREKYLSRDSLFKLLYADPKAKLATAEDLITSMDQNNIDISVALNIHWSSPELCIDSNSYIMEAISRYPDRLIGFGMVDLNSPDTAIPEIERCARGGCKGIGEIRPEPVMLKDPQLLEPVIHCIIDHNLILLTHASEPVGHLYPGKGDITPEVLYPLLAVFPDLKLVFSHWGGGLPFYALMPEVKKALGNVYFDSAASPFLYKAQIYGHVAQLVGSEKVLFGTDYPLLSPGRLLKEIAGSDLPEIYREQLLAGNAQKLLGI
jgi:predicted TIM-barrel fold metal-dependent hydrolase